MIIAVANTMFTIIVIIIIVTIVTVVMIVIIVIIITSSSEKRQRESEWPNRSERPPVDHSEGRERERPIRRVCHIHIHIHSIPLQRRW